jgi:hypothetical protein
MTSVTTPQRSPSPRRFAVDATGIPLSPDPPIGLVGLLKSGRAV